MTSPMSDVNQAASGAIVAQAVVASIKDGDRDADLAWLRFAELSATHGRYSPACRAFVVELAKRAGG